MLFVSVAGGIEVECDFGQVITNHKVITRFHNIDYGRFVSNAGKSSFSYSVTNVILKQILNGTCYQSVDQLCQPWVQPLYEIDKLHELRQNTSSPIHACHCLRYRHLLTSNLTLSTNGWVISRYVSRTYAINSKQYAYSTKGMMSLNVLPQITIWVSAGCGIRLYRFLLIAFLSTQ